MPQESDYDFGFRGEIEVEGKEEGEEDEDMTNKELGAESPRSNSAVSDSSSLTQSDVSNILPRTRTNRKRSDLLREDSVSKTQNLYQRVIEERGAPQNKLVRTNSGVPRPVVRNLRAIYAQMFMNSVNSADLNTVQNFFCTFMSGPCTFVANHRVRDEYGIPQVLTAFSPQLFSHYLLGCYVSFPDMVLRMGDNRIYTHGGRTRIEMETEVFCTKIYDIPDFPWAPDVNMTTRTQSRGF